MPGMPPDQPKGQLAIMPHIVPFLGVRPARAGSDHWWYGLFATGILHGPQFYAVATTMCRLAGGFALFWILRPGASRCHFPLNQNLTAYPAAVRSFAEKHHHARMNSVP